MKLDRNTRAGALRIIPQIDNVKTWTKDVSHAVWGYEAMAASSRCLALLVP